MQDRSTTIKGQLKNEIQSLEAAAARLRKEVKSLEAARDRVKTILESIDTPREYTMIEAIDFFLENKCILDPRAWESYDRLYDAFDLFKKDEGIKTRMLKRNFFEILARRGYLRNKGKGRFIGQPDNSINGLYLKENQENIDPAPPRETDEEYIKRILEERDRADQEEQARRLNAIIAQNETGGGLFDF